MTTTPTYTIDLLDRGKAQATIDTIIDDMGWDAFINHVLTAAQTGGEGFADDLDRLVATHFSDPENADRIPADYTGPEPYSSRFIADQNGAEVPPEDRYIGDDTASDGERITSAKALQIVADVLRVQQQEGCSPHRWTFNDIRIARSVVAAIRGQWMTTEDDSERRLTEDMDLAIYG